MAKIKAAAQLFSGLSGFPIALVAGLGPSLALFSPKAMVFVGMVAALAAIYDWVRHPRALNWRFEPSMAFPVLFVIWMFISCLWSPDLVGGLAKAAAVTGTAVLGALVIYAAGRTPSRMERWVIFGFGAAVALTLIECVDGMWLSRLLRTPNLPYEYFTEVHLKAGSAVLSIWIWPVLAILVARGRVVLAIALYATFAAAAIMVGSVASLLALSVGAVAAVACSRFWQARHTIAAAAVVLLLVTPLIAGQLHDRLPRGVTSSSIGSLGARLLIWDYGSDLAFANPAGMGMDASRHVGPDPERPGSGREIRLHPHNGFIQIAMELGIPGALLATLLLRQLVVGALRGPLAAETCFRLAAILAAITIGAVSFGVWQSWWMMSQWLVAALFAVPSKKLDISHAR